MHAELLIVITLMIIFYMGLNRMVAGTLLYYILIGLEALTVVSIVHYNPGVVLTPGGVRLEFK